MARKKGKLPRDLTLETQAAAYLASQGEGQARIAGVLGVSQGEVSRLLAAARRAGWLQTRCVLPPGAAEAVERVIFAGRGELEDVLGREADRHGAAPVRNVRVVHSGGEAGDPAGWDARLRRFGLAAAARLQEQLPGMQLAGVAWGRAIGRLADGLRQLNPHAPQLPAPIRFVPLAGEPLSYPDPETSSSTLAYRLSEACNADPPRFHSLAAVPAFIPARFPRRGREAIRDFIAEIAGYREIFGGGGAKTKPQGSLADQLDCVITGVGAVTAGASGRLLDDRLAAENISKEELGARSFGDIGGVFLPKAPRDAVVRGINERWTGVRLEHLARCARAAATDTSRAGVFALAVGRAKAPVVLESVRRGLITELVVDHDLARALLEHYSPAAE